jgi:hypothetical protein
MSKQRSDARSGGGGEKKGVVADMYKYGGAFALIGLTFFHREKEGEGPILVRLTGLHGKGETYRATEFKTEKGLPNSVSPGELTIGIRSRTPRDAVILLLRKLKLPYEAYLDPLAERPGTGHGEYLTLETEMGLGTERRRPSAPPVFNERGPAGPRGIMPRALGRKRLGTPFQGAQWSQPRQPSGQQFLPAMGGGLQQGVAGFPQAAAGGFQAAVGSGFQPAMGARFQPVYRPVPAATGSQRMPRGRGFAEQQPFQENQDESVHEPGRGRREASGGFERAERPGPAHSQQGGGAADTLEARTEALESSRQIERLRGAMSSELRRMQSGVSPFEHPGVYSHVDQMVTIHELPRTWTGPLTVSATSGSVLIADHVKLAFLAEAIWEFTKRKCAEAGENLSEKQIMEIEAQTLEFYGKQRVEAKKFLEKARLNTGKGYK